MQVKTKQVFGEREGPPITIEVGSEKKKMKGSHLQSRMKKKELINYIYKGLYRKSNSTTAEVRVHDREIFRYSLV